LPDFSVVIGEHVARIGIDADDPLYPNVESSFFSDFPDGGFG
jgi:hypothetical protein